MFECFLRRVAACFKASVYPWSEGVYFSSFSNLKGELPAEFMNAEDTLLGAGDMI